MGYYGGLIGSNGIFNGIFNGVFFWDLMGFLLASGWWFQPTPLKNDGVKVSWDDYSQYMEK